LAGHSARRQHDSARPARLYDLRRERRPVAFVVVELAAGALRVVCPSAAQADRIRQFDVLFARTESLILAWCMARLNLARSVGHATHSLV
jgi:hypothetical protein